MLCLLPPSSKLCKMLGQNHFAEPDRHVLNSTRSSCNELPMSLVILLVRNALFLWDRNCVCLVECEICMCFVGSNLYVLFEERERERGGGGFGSAQECGRLLKRERERSRRICNICQPRIRRAREKSGFRISLHASTALGPAFAFLLILFKMI